jgi:hypothetical protein
MHTHLWQKIDHAKSGRNVSLAARPRHEIDEWLVCYRQMLKGTGLPKKTRRDKSRKILKDVLKLQ